MSFSKPSAAVSAVERMNSLKEGEKKDFPSQVGMAGALVGSAMPFVLVALAPKEWTAPWSSLDRTESVLVVLQSFSLFSLLFLYEFVLGVQARVISAQAAFSPAAAQLANTAPFQVVECNRIHQNHIEAACIYVPAVVSAAATASVETNLLVASSLTWVAARILYRWGYQQEQNPLWRLFGTSASMSQSFLCLGLFAYHTIKIN